MICELCGTKTRTNWANVQTVLCEDCYDSDEGREILANRSEKATYEKSEEGTRSWDEDGMGKWGESIGESFGCLVWVAFFIWVIIVAFADNYKVSEAKNSKLAGAIRAVRVEAFKSFPGANVRFEPRFGENLRVYISKNHFEAVPYPDRSSIIAQLGKAWCRNIQLKFLLPSLSIHDIRNADKLASYNCALKQLW